MKRPSNKRNPGCKCFSHGAFALIELLVVIAITTFLAMTFVMYRNNSAIK